MRTVHETEALRPSDPVPKHHPSSLVAPTQPPSSAKQPRLRLVFSSKSSATDQDSQNGLAGGSDADDEDPYPADLEFTPHELSLPPVELFRLLRRQIRWAEEAGQELQAEVKELQAEKKKVARENGLVMDDLLRVVGKRAGATGMDLRKWLDDTTAQAEAPTA
jgi:hypothetical protein